MPKDPDWKAEIKKRLAGLRLEPVREGAIIEELSQHLESLREELLADGAAPAEVARVLFEELDESDLLQRELRGVERQASPERAVPRTNRRGKMIADLWQDVRFALRMIPSHTSYPNTSPRPSISITQLSTSRSSSGRRLHIPLESCCGSI